MMNSTSSLQPEGEEHLESSPQNAGHNALIETRFSVDGRVRFTIPSDVLNELRNSAEVPRESRLLQGRSSPFSSSTSTPIIASKTPPPSRGAQRSLPTASLNSISASEFRLRISKASQNPVTLSFKDQTLEDQFRCHFNAQCLQTNRIIFLVLNLLFGFLLVRDHMVGILDNILVVSLSVRLSFVFVAVLIFISQTLDRLRPFWERWIQVYSVLITLLLSMSSILMSMYATTNIVYGGLLLVLLTSQTVVRMRFFLSTPVAWLVVFVLNYSISFRSDTPIYRLLSINFYFVCATFVGMFAAHLNEETSRRDFLQCQVIAKEREQHVDLCLALDSHAKKASESQCKELATALKQLTHSSNEALQRVNRASSISSSSLHHRKSAAEPAAASASSSSASSSSSSSSSISLQKQHYRSALIADYQESLQLCCKRALDLYNILKEASSADADNALDRRRLPEMASSENDSQHAQFDGDDSDSDADSDSDIEEDDDGTELSSFRQAAGRISSPSSLLFEMPRAPQGADDFSDIDYAATLPSSSASWRKTRHRRNSLERSNSQLALAALSFVPSLAHPYHTPVDYSDGEEEQFERREIPFVSANYVIGVDEIGQEDMIVLNMSSLER